MRRPSLAQLVVAAVDPAINSGSPEAPAVITRVWGEHADGGWVVNVRAFVDSQAYPPHLKSVRLFDQPSVEGAATGTAWWPPGV